MSKNIVLFVDGTWNIPTVTRRTCTTNVHKLHELTSTSASQTKAYLAGIGTGEFEDSGELRPPSRAHRLIRRITRLGRPVLSLPFGFGTKRRITRAYEFLSSQYCSGDHVYLFGFSRGAFAARSLAGFVDAVGLLFQERIDLVEKAYALYEDGEPRDRSPLDRYLRDMTGSGRPTGDNVAVLPIYFIGVWDSVAALGLPRQLHRLSAAWTEYHQTEVPANVTHARQALALHELRIDYPPLLWRGRNPQNQNQTLEQVWFSGAHADVGGGYPDPDHALSDVAFAWMAQEAAKVGLQLDAPPPKDALPAGPATLHHELRRLFAFSKPAVRNALAQRDRLEARTLETFRIHPSVLQRLAAGPAPRYDFRRPQINAMLGTIDDLSLQFYLELRFHPSGAPGTPIPEWLKAVRIEDIAECANRVRDFLTASGAASDPEREAFVRSLCLWMVVDDGVAKAVADLVESTAASLEAKFLRPTPELRVLGQWLARLKAVPTDLKKAEPLLPLHRREETAALADRLDQLHRRLNGAAVELAADPRTWIDR